MRRFLGIAAAVLIVLAVSAWAGGQYLLVSFASGPLVHGNGRFSAAEVTPLLDPRRFGMRLQEARFHDFMDGLYMEQADLYVPLQAPTRLTADLSGQGMLWVGDMPLLITSETARLSLSVAPMREFGLSAARAHFRAVSAEGIGVLARTVDIAARLVHMGAAAPQGSHASYRITIELDGLPVPPLSDDASAAGEVQIWLNFLPRPDPYVAPGVEPGLTGAQTHGLRLTLGAAEAVLIGRVEADAQGYASGEAALYTADAQGLVESLVTAGLLPPEAALPVLALVNNLSETPVPSDSAPPPASDDEAVSLPPAPEGQIRLPLTLSDGEMKLGPVPVGPAPRLTAAPSAAAGAEGTPAP